MGTAALLEAGTLVGGYRIEALLGRGGMAVVYRATQLALERPVALKLMAPRLTGDDEFRARFEREAKTAATLDHPHVLPVYDFGQVEHALFISMRLVAGGDLSKFLAGGPLEPSRVLAIVSQVSEALDAAHARGLVHRDVKPSNILVEGTLGREHAYLADFGLARVSSPQPGLTRVDQILGTPDFIAPEQIRGDHVDARTDVYALGCVLYQALTGYVVFPDEDDMAKLWAHLHDSPPRPSESSPRLPAALDSVITRALAKDRTQRYASCGEFVEAATGALTKGTVHRRTQADTVLMQERIPDATVVEARTESTRPVESRTSRWRGRSAALIAGLAVLLVGASAGTVVAVNQFSDDEPEDLAGPAPRTTEEQTTNSETAPTTTAPADPNAFPNAAERTILAAVPQELSGACERASAEDREAESVAGVVCDVVGGILAYYELFPTRDALDRSYWEYYRSHVRPEGIGRNEVSCFDAKTGEHQYDNASHQTVGRQLCYVDEEGDSIVIWKHDPLLIQAYAVGSDHTALMEFWRGAGPEG